MQVLASNVGKYVDYTPVSGTFSDHVGETYSGDTSNRNTQLSTVTGLNWRILSASNNTLTLISETVANTGFTLNSYNGYNNGVLLLNNACKAMYSNGLLGATGRSLNIDDIETYSNYSGASLIEYTPQYTNYPKIFAKELNGAPNGTYGTELDLSEQDEYITDVESLGDSLLKGKQTYYTFSMSASTMDSQTYADLFSSSTTAWIASRCVNFDRNNAMFRIFYVNGYTVDATSYALYDSSGGDNESQLCNSSCR